MRVCKTAGCQGRLVPRDVLTRGMEGTTTLVYVCDHCLCIWKLEASNKNTPLANNDISLAAQVAFITAGCTYTTYANALQLLGIKPVNNHAFMKTLETLHPIVEAMVNAMCEREKQCMKDMNKKKLGSWKRAVTCADGTWMTRGFHSKNATFSIRNYKTGALLYYMHICQKGRAGGSNLTVVRPFAKREVRGSSPGKVRKNAACWCILVLFKGYLINNHNHEDGDICG